MVRNGKILRQGKGLERIGKERLGREIVRLMSYDFR